MQRQGDEVVIIVIGIGKILDIPAEFFIGGHHRQGLIVNICGNAHFCHLHDDLLPLGFIDAGDPGDVQMTGAAEVFALVGQVHHAQLVADGVVLLDDVMTALHQAFVAIELLEADGGHDVGHVALVPGSDDVVLPGAHLGLCQGVLALAVEAVELVLVVHLLVVDAGDIPPGGGAALGCGEVFPSLVIELDHNILWFS